MDSILSSVCNAFDNLVVDTLETIGSVLEKPLGFDLTVSYPSNMIDTDMDMQETLEDMLDVMSKPWQDMDFAFDVYETSDTDDDTPSKQKQRNTVLVSRRARQDRVIANKFREPADLPDVWPLPNIATVKMNVCDINDPKTQSDIKQIGHKVYDLPRGIALIVNNRNFNGVRDPHGNVLDDRNGTDRDATNLSKTFRELGMTVWETLNCTANDILDVVFDVAVDEQSKSCFICVLLSHGANGIVYGVDGQPVNLVDLTKVAQNALPFGPKIFIIQACQGNQKNHAVIEKSGSLKTGSTPPEQNTHPPPYAAGSQSIVQQTRDEHFLSLREMEKEFAKLDASDSTTTPSGITQSASHADIFIAFATVKGYVSWRNKSGSWFIQALVYALRKWAHCDDIDGILTWVTNLVLRHEHQLYGYKQVVMKRSTLTKKFYFFPGVTEEVVRRFRR